MYIRALTNCMCARALESDTAAIHARESSCECNKYREKRVAALFFFLSCALWNVSRFPVYTSRKKKGIYTGD